MDLTFLCDKYLSPLPEKNWGRIQMNLALAIFSLLLLLAPIPVPIQWLCQYKHVCSHIVNQQEEVPGLKIAASLDLRAAPGWGYQRWLHRHWQIWAQPQGTYGCGNELLEEPFTCKWCRCWQKCLSNYQQWQGTCARTEGRTETNFLVFQIHALYIHTVTLLSLVKGALAQI